MRPTCVDHDHFDVIEYYYNSIVTAVSKATAMSVPPATADRDKMRVPGWSDYAQDKYDSAMDVYMSWLYAGKPRSALCVKLELLSKMPYDTVVDIVSN